LPFTQSKSFSSEYFDQCVAQGDFGKENYSYFAQFPGTNQSLEESEGDEK